MSKLLQIGMSTAAELGTRYGHIACTLDGVNYESRGGRGCLKGSAARGATSPLFRHRFHLRLTDAQAARAKAYADSCVGQPYVLGGVPTAQRGGDCSGYVSGIVCKAKGMPLKRLFATATWLSRFDDSDMGFSKGLGGLEEDDLTKDELLDALSSSRGQQVLRKAVNAEVTHVLRVAVGPDDGKTPASRFFNRLGSSVEAIKKKVGA
jgi:hypothetical protein